MTARRPLVLVSGKTRQMTVAEFNDLRWQMLPLGVPFPIWSHITGVQLPPTNSTSYRYIKLTASDSYNAGVLTSESVSGSAPHVQATAVISDAASALNGRTVRLINTGRWLLRPGESGVVELDALQGHKHRLPSTYPSQDFAIYGAIAGSPQSFTHGDGTATAYGHLTSTPTDSDGTNGSPRVGNATRDKSVGADFYMRIR